MFASTTALDHITLICKDLDKTAAMFKELFGAEEVYATNKNIYSIAKERFFKIQNIWFIIMEGEATTKTYNHIAFKVFSPELKMLREKVEKMGLQILAGRTRTRDEGEALYFYDYDNHLFEFHSGSLEKRLRYYRSRDKETEEK